MEVQKNIQNIKDAFDDRIREHNASKEKLEKLADKLMNEIYEFILHGDLPLQRGIICELEIREITPDLSSFTLQSREDHFNAESIEWQQQLRREEGFKLNHIRQVWDGYLTYEELLELCEVGPLFETCKFSMPHIADWEHLIKDLERRGLLIGFTVYGSEDDTPKKVESVISIAFEL